MLGYLSTDIICSEKCRSRKTVRFSEQIIGSLRNHNGDAEDNVENHFMVSLRILRYLKLFTLFITVKTIAKLNPEHNDKFDIKI